MGKMRPQKANIIIRRQNVGSASNDMGFVKKADGTYDIIVDQYSQTSLKYDQSWLGKLKQAYAASVATKTMKKMSKQVTKTVLPNKTIKLSIQV